MGKAVKRSLRDLSVNARPFDRSPTEIVEYVKRDPEFIAYLAVEDPPQRNSGFFEQWWEYLSPKKARRGCFTMFPGCKGGREMWDQIMTDDMGTWQKRAVRRDHSSLPNIIILQFTISA